MAFWVPQFLRSGTLFDVFKHVTIVRRLSQLHDRGQSAFIFEQENSILYTMCKILYFHLNTFIQF